MATVTPESSVTMVDVLNDEKELEEETAAVLGGSDEKNCTYKQGYVKRQALYSCLTCVPEARQNYAEKGAGICLACSYACHENHELVELYTKRNFRCDCGTARMLGGSKCMLDGTKEEANDRNEYNQNYGGLYCTCHRPYPDPDAPNDDDEMIQCIVCEDWYHSRHLEVPLPPSNDFFEMTCGPCMAQNPFLSDYLDLSVTKIAQNKDENASEQAVNVEVTAGTELNNTASDKPEGDTDGSGGVDGTAAASNEDQVDDEEHDHNAKRMKLEDEDNKTTTAVVNDKDDINDSKARGYCIRPKHIPLRKTSGATFWPNDWRNHLCTCATCMTMYSTFRVEYLVDMEDTVQYYEERGLKKQAEKETDYDRGMRELSSMDRVRQIDAITAYNRMKDRLKEYLNHFVTSQQVVTEADIKRFFQQMRMEDLKDSQEQNSGVPYHCR